MKSSSPLLFREIDEIKTGTNDARCTFKNGSWIRVVASNQGARSKNIYNMNISFSLCN